mgnify:CR=1 FL=1
MKVVTDTGVGVVKGNGAVVFAWTDGGPLGKVIVVVVVVRVAFGGPVVVIWAGGAWVKFWIEDIGLGGVETLRVGGSGLGDGCLGVGCLGDSCLGDGCLCGGAEGVKIDVALWMCVSFGGRVTVSTIGLTVE